ncbi:unnamed protein product, partial [marine sediment metagenome]
IGASLAPAIRRLADWLGPVIDSMIDWVDANKELVTAITATTAAMGVMLLISGTLILSLAGLALAAAGLNISVAALATVISVTTLGIGALIGSITLVILRIAKMRAEVRRLKKELELSTEIAQLQKYIDELTTLVTEPGPMNLLIGRMEAIKSGIAEIEEAMGKALTATRKELMQMLEEAELEVPTGWLGIPKATSVIREYYLRMAEYTRDMVIRMSKDAKIEAERLMEDTTEIIEREEGKRATIFEMAKKLRERQREGEYKDWVATTGAISKEWSRIDAIMVETTRETFDDMQDAMTDFFTDTIM